MKPQLSLTSSAAETLSPRADQAPQVLVVDDDDTIRDTVADALELEGYTVARARHGEEALSHVRAAPPRVIVIDLMMPIMDGWTFLEHLHQIPAHIGTPVVVTSADRTPSEPETARELQVQAHLAKPFEGDTLVGVVARKL